MKYFDAFSGYGGFSLGIKKAYGNNLSGRDRAAEEGNGETDTSLTGVEATKADTQRQGNTSSHLKFRNIGEVSCIGFSEIDKYAIQVYSKHFNHKNYGSITDIDANTLPDFDLFVGGFPCQAFSIAGKRAGFEDTRGTLIYDVFRIIKEKHPRLVLLENVKGLLSHDGGRTFKTIITALAELGYAVEWQVLNAKNFGVPQNRERVFIVGHLRGQTQIFLSEEQSQNDKTNKTSRTD
jgi:DNA-cytosine methyltransferase